MAAHGKPRKLIGLAAVLGLMMAAAIGGYTVAHSRTPAALNLAAAQGGVSPQTMTVHACLAAGRLTQVSVTAPTCPANSVPVQWSVQSDPTASANPQPTSAPSATSAPTAPPSTTPPSAPAGGTVFTASCPAHGSSSAPGCGSWNAGPSSGQAPGFAAGQQSSPNLLGVNQDPWTTGQGPQVLSASSFQNWSVTATDTDPSNAPGEVLTYPDASFNYYALDTAASGYKAPPAQYDLSNITSLTSDFTESMPQNSDLNAEAAYDLWLNNWQTEVMVWVDTSPAKDRNLADDGMTKVGTYTYGGQNFALWRSGSGITGFYVFLLDHNETSGTVDLKSMLETMVSLGYIPAASPLTQIPFGWEISDTGGQPVTFSMSRFDVNLQN
jgi:Glycosyl hydrolase family 12